MKHTTLKTYQSLELKVITLSQDVITSSTAATEYAVEWNTVWNSGTEN